MSSIEEESPSMKGNNQLEKRLNTIRQRSNSLWKECSRKYSRFLSAYLRIILPLSLILSVGLSAYFLAFIRVRPFDQEDFLLRSAESFENARRLREIFGDDSTLRTHQQLQLHPALDVIIKRKVSTDVADANQTNMLDEKIFDEVSVLNELIQAIVVQSSENASEFNYSSLCVRRNHACMIEGNYLLSQTFRQALANLLPPTNGYYVDNHGANGIPEFMFGKNYRVVNATPAVSDYEDEEIDGKSLDEILQTTTTMATPELVKIISHVPLFRLRYSLQSSTPQSKRLALQWERKALEFLTETYRSSSIEVAVSTSRAIGETVAKKAHEEGLFLAFTLLLFFVFVNFFSSIEGNRLTSLGLLPICGFIGIVLSSGAAFGLLTLFQVQLIEPMALIVFGVAIFESMRISIVCGEYHRIVEKYLRTLPSPSAAISAEEIFSSIVESTHPFFLVTTLSLALVYFLLATFTPMVPSMLICLTLVVHLLTSYLVHSTFFSSCLVLTLRRVAARRHCFSCQRLASEPEENILSARKFPSPFRIDSISKRFISALFCLLSIVGIFFSVWFTLSIETRLFDDAFLPADASSLRSYMKSQVEDFDIGPVVMFTIPQPVDYADSNVRQAMSSLLEQCQNENRINDFRLFWLDHENLDVILHEKTPLEFRILPFSQNDLAVKEEHNQSTIVASRFYCQYRSLQGDREDIRTMNHIYADAKQSSLPSVFPYSLIFPSYESLAQIRFDTYLLVLMVIVVPFFLTFISFVWLKVSLSIAFHSLFLITSTLAVLYQFHRFTFNFANAMWLLILPVLFAETLVHSAFFHRQSRWKYNRVFLSLIISLIILYVYPIQSYVFLTIRNSLMYQSVICLILINFFLPSSHHFLLKLRNAEVAAAATPFQMTTVIPEGQQALTSGIEVQSETTLKMKGSM